MTQQQQANDLDVLNELIAELGRLPSPQTRLVLEHPEGARYYLTGAMPAELAMNLNLAEASLDSLHDEALKSRIRRFIQTHHGE